jgi:hypothetical protein
VRVAANAGAIPAFRSNRSVMYWLHVDGGMGMDEGRYFRELASRCYELGRACFDLDISLQLNEIGDELLLNATKLDAACPQSTSTAPLRT